MKKFISIFLCIAIVFSLSACSFSGGNAVFSIGTSDTINSFDPILASTDTENMLSANCFEGLVRFDEHGNITLAGATAYTTEKYGLSYIFKLNPEAEWHMDGKIKDTIKALGLNDFDSSITARDYVFGFEKFKESSPELDSIKEITATDNYTLKITLSREDYDLLYKLAALPLFPCSKAFCDAIGNKYATSPETTLFNGPYYVEQYSQNETIISRSRYYNGNIQVKAKQVHIYTGVEKKALAEQFANNTLNLYIADSLGSELKNYEASNSSYDTVWGIAFNCQSKLGSSKAFREVLFKSISAPDEISLPAFSIAKAESIFPATYTVGGRAFSEFANEKTIYEQDIDSAIKTLNSLKTKYKIKSYSITFAAPYDMKAAAEKIIEDWTNLFGDSVIVTLTLYNKEEAQSIAEQANYDIAILPIRPKNNTASSLFNSIPCAPCYYGSNELWSLGKDISTISNNNFTIYSNTEKHLIESSVFIPLFYTGRELYVSDKFHGVYLANGGKLIYFHSGEEV